MGDSDSTLLYNNGGIKCFRIEKFYKIIQMLFCNIFFLRKTNDLEITVL